MRLRQFAQSEIPRDMPNLQMASADKAEDTHIVVRILNGCGVSGVAYKLREYLLTQGFDVSETTNADHFNYEKTIVYLHTKDYKMSTVLSRALHISNNPVLDDRAPDYPCHVTILIGKDYHQLPPFK